jgi:hypothetical protein
VPFSLNIPTVRLKEVRQGYFHNDITNERKGYFHNDITNERKGYFNNDITNERKGYFHNDITNERKHFEMNVRSLHIKIMFNFVQSNTTSFSAGNMFRLTNKSSSGHPVT